MDSQKMGVFVAARRKALGWTQQQLAEKLAVTNKAVSKWETGDGYPDIASIPALAETLGVSSDELLAGELKVGADDQVKDRLELSAYLLDKAIVRFHNLTIICCGLAIAGIVAFYVLWVDYQLLRVLLPGVFLEVLSAVLWAIGCNRLEAEIRKYQALMPDKKIHMYSIIGKPLLLLLSLWLLVPILRLLQLVAAKTLGFIASPKIISLFSLAEYFAVLVAVVVVVVIVVIIRRKLCSKDLPIK